MIDRTVRGQLQPQRGRIHRRRGQAVAAVGFFNLLTGPELLERTERNLPEHRERLYRAVVALLMFIR